jgi:hypothetical protein
VHRGYRIKMPEGVFGRFWACANIGNRLDKLI